MWDRRAKVKSVHDGDTVTVILDQGFGDTKEFDLRLLGTFAPELKDPGGPETEQFVEQWLNTHMGTLEWPFVVITARTKISDKEQRSLTRYVGTLTSFDGTDNLNADVEQFVRDKGYGGGVGSK